MLPWEWARGQRHDRSRAFGGTSELSNHLVDQASGYPCQPAASNVANSAYISVVAWGAFRRQQAGELCRMSRAARRCSRVSRNGHNCRSWAVRGSDPPQCAAHGGKRTEAGDDEESPWSFYHTALSDLEAADLLLLPTDQSLADEIAAARVALRRVLVKLQSGMTNDVDKQGHDFQRELTPSEYARLSSLIFAGAKTVAKLLQEQRGLSNKSADGITGAVNQALDELSGDWGIDL